MHCDIDGGDLRNERGRKPLQACLNLTRALLLVARRTSHKKKHHSQSVRLQGTLFDTKCLLKPDDFLLPLVLHLASPSVFCCCFWLCFFFVVGDTIKGKIENKNPKERNGSLELSNMKGVAVTLLACALSSVSANRYECDVAPMSNVEADLYDIDYDERKQQREIDDWNELLDAAVAASAGNNSCGALEFHNVDDSLHSTLIGGCENEIMSGGEYVTWVECFPQLTICT